MQIGERARVWRRYARRNVFVKNAFEDLELLSKTKDEMTLSD